MYPIQKKNQNLKDNPLDKHNVAWNASNLFYIFLNELDMDYRDAYYVNDWDKMYKVYKLKYMKVIPFIKKKASDKQIICLKDTSEIKKKLAEIKSSDTDFASRFNNTIISDVLEIIESKMLLIDGLMSLSGMNLLMEKITVDRPAALATDDFFQE